MSAGRRNVSLFILVILGLQAVPVMREWTGARETLWPFLSWGMFRHASGPPVQAERLRMFASTGEGSRIVGAADTGFDRFGFRRYYQVPILAGDSTAVKELAQRLSDRWRVQVHWIVLERTAFTLSRDSLRTTTTVRRVPAEPQPDKSAAAEAGP